MRVFSLNYLKNDHLISIKNNKKIKIKNIYKKI